MPLEKGKVRAVPASPKARQLLAKFASSAIRIDHADPPRATRLTLLALVGMLAGFGVWASLSSMDIVTLARGRLVSVAPNLVVQPLETSILRSVEVRVGQRVRQGDVLARLDPTFVTADATQIDSRRSALTQQVARLEAELAGRTPVAGAPGLGVDQNRLRDERRAAFDARLRQFDEGIGRLRAATQTNASDQLVLAARLKTLRSIEDMNESLAEQQFVARNRVLESRERRLEVEREFKLAELRATELRRELAGLKEERSAYMSDWRSRTMEELTKIRQELAEVTAQGGKAVRRNELLVLRAPADAVVLEIAPRSTGSVIREAEALLTLVRSDTDLEIEADIDPADVGFLIAGQRARVKFDAYPFQKHGTLEAELISVSRDSLVAGGANGVGPERRRFSARLALKSRQLAAAPADAALSPGMALTAEVVTGSRTVASYLSYPIIRAVDEGLRER